MQLLASDQRLQSSHLMVRRLICLQGLTNADGSVKTECGIHTVAEEVPGKGIHEHLTLQRGAYAPSTAGTLAHIGTSASLTVAAALIVALELSSLLAAA